MAREFSSIEDLPDPLPTDAMAIIIRGEKIVLYVQSTGKMVGYRFDVMDGFNLAYLMLGATLQRLREMGQRMPDPAAGLVSLEAFEKMMGDADLDIEKPWSKRSDDETEEPPSDLRFF